mmetsp:Transcript_13399/g.26993  ORF Transcript_13399/g.26993 Transcript_13399/m.26993 type:complete len:426 (-) Transcript_13399:145-1422(-)
MPGKLADGCISSFNPLGASGTLTSEVHDGTDWLGNLTYCFAAGDGSHFSIGQKVCFRPCWQCGPWALDVHSAAAPARGAEGVARAADSSQGPIAVYACTIDGSDCRADPTCCRGQAAKLRPTLKRSFCSSYAGGSGHEAIARSVIGAPPAASGELQTRRGQGGTPTAMKASALLQRAAARWNNMDSLRERELYVEGLQRRLSNALEDGSQRSRRGVLRSIVGALASPRLCDAPQSATQPLDESARERLRRACQARLRALALECLCALDLHDARSSPALIVLWTLISDFEARTGVPASCARAGSQWAELKAVLEPSGDSLVLGCGICRHGKPLRSCASCAGCSHGKLTWNCKVCSGCPHGKVKKSCRKCPEQLHSVCWLYSREVEASMHDLRWMLPWEAEGPLQYLHGLSSWKAERQLRNVQPLRS